MKHRPAATAETRYAALVDAATKAIVSADVTGTILTWNQAAVLLAGGESEILQMGQKIAVAHHERWDGTGYPDGLTQEEIPLPARIVSVVDTFDAITRPRPSRSA